ncbi:MAG: MarR family transcriptional regulator [Bacteroidetes bacterium]|nr:MarR family transcriptional regulator [Bacteroidota bacterium]HET6245850.1 MarR family transcriptional regulator [Bacteroidia bacterium]
MKIEQEIKQEVFKDDYQKAVINILYTASWLNLKQTQLFKKYGITPPQYNVLRILRGQFPNTATVNLIIDRMLDKNSNASRIVEKLRLKKLIERITCPQDRRSVNVKINQNGLELLAEIDKIEKQFAEGINSLTQKEAALLNELLDKARG